MNKGLGKTYGIVGDVPLSIWVAPIATPAEQWLSPPMTSKEHLARIHELNCVVCRFFYGKFRPCNEAHHLEFERGAHSDYAVVPLCHDCHHQLHAGRRRSFYRAHKGMSDVSLLAYTIKLLMEQE